MVERVARVAKALLAVAVTLAGCAESGDPYASGAERIATYSVRGEVVTLPPDNDGELRLAHEAIDDFVAASGDVVGMDAMTMSFALAPGVSPEGLAVGDPIRFELEVNWDSESLARITRLEKLPEGTDIPFRAARPSES